MTRTGRPKSSNPKNVRLEVRLTEGEAARLQECANTLQINRTEVILRGIDLVEAEIRAKEIEQALD